VVRLAVFETGGLPWLFTTVVIVIVTRSETFRLPPSVTTTVYGAGPVPMRGVTFTKVPKGAPVTVTAVTSNMAGRLSVTTTPVAGVLPAFVTVMVKTTVSPTEACVGLPAFDKAGSATNAALAV
jgi:hypothetical protein